MTRVNIFDWRAGEADTEDWRPSPDNYWWRPRWNHYLSSDLLLPGDILLFRPRNPNLFQKAIINYQRRNGAGAAHAGFTHAAIFIGVDHLICEAGVTQRVPPSGNVVIRSLEDKIHDSDLLVRRLPGVSLRHRHEICLLAAGSRGEQYDVRRVLVHFFLGANAITEKNARRGVVCSTLCSRVLTKAAAPVLPAEKIAFRDGAGLVAPADLSNTANLEDVPLSPRKVKRH